MKFDYMIILGWSLPVCTELYVWGLWLWFIGTIVAIYVPELRTCLLLKCGTPTYRIKQCKFLNINLNACFM